MKSIPALLILTCFLLAACIPGTPTSSARIITVQYTAAAIPWLADLYDCAGANIVNAEQRAADFLDLQSVDLAIRIGQAENMTTTAYQLGVEELLVIINPQNPVTALTAEQVRRLFTGQILNWHELDGPDAGVQVWVFSASEDIQQVFEQTALDGSPITSMARLAVSPEEMVQAIANDVNAVGILTNGWKTGNESEVFTVTTVPVLAITQAELQDAVQELLACLQK